MATSSQILADLKTVQTNGFSATTNANANAPAGVIQDMLGNVELCVVGFTDAKRRLIEIIKDVDASSDAANLALLANIRDTLV